MNHEVSPAPIRNPDGSLNEEVLNKRFGLGIGEAEQEVRFGSHTGTVADMLSDGRCPVGGIIHSAYVQTGIAGVVEQFETLRTMDPNFKVEFTQPTLERNHVKKK